MLEMQVVDSSNPPTIKNPSQKEPTFEAHDAYCTKQALMHSNLKVLYRIPEVSEASNSTLHLESNSKSAENLSKAHDDKLLLLLHMLPSDREHPSCCRGSAQIFTSRTCDYAHTRRECWKTA